MQDVDKPIQTGSTTSILVQLWLYGSKHPKTVELTKDFRRTHHPSIFYFKHYAMLANLANKTDSILFYVAFHYLLI